MKETIAVFDFDKTITDRDSFEDLLKYTFGKKVFWKNILKNSLFLFLYILGILKNDYVKGRTFQHFFGNMDVKNFESICTKYSQERLTQIIREEALEKIIYHQKQNHIVIIITASLKYWIEPWAREQGISYILGTSVKIKDEKILGLMPGSNCYGKEKVNRLLEAFPNKNEYLLYAYGDSKGDKQLLEIADFSFYKCFN